MNLLIRFALKLLVFLSLFFLLTVPVAFLLKDDTNSYARALFHEFYDQEGIDWLLMGASHTSHGVEANTASAVLGKKVFNTGTPSQKIDGSYAILRQAVKRYKLEKVFLELDFAITCEEPFSRRTGFKAEYIVASGLRDRAIKTDYLLHCSRPIYYLNSFLPIGKDKLMTVNPRKIVGKITSLVSGDYFTCTYRDPGSEYAGKGCVLDSDSIPDGSFSNSSREDPIPVGQISSDWMDTVDSIAALCRENNIELILYSMPGSDFYLNERGNYDAYYAFCRDFAAERGLLYYDFNLAKPELLSLEDSCYSDDNHLNKKGVYRWTDVFCAFFAGDYAGAGSLEDKFYASYKEKMDAQADRIFGLYLLTSDDKSLLTIEPVVNHVEASRITYDVYALTGGQELLLAKGTSSPTVALPAGKSGKIRVVSYIDGVQENDCRENFAAF